jgi:hypothetical protein
VKTYIEHLEDVEKAARVFDTELPLHVHVQALRRLRESLKAMREFRNANKNPQAPNAGGETRLPSS